MWLYYYCELENEQWYRVRYSCEANKSCDGIFLFLKGKDGSDAIQFTKPSIDQPEGFEHYAYAAMWNALRKFGTIPTVKTVAAFY